MTEPLITLPTSTPTPTNNTSDPDPFFAMEGGGEPEVPMPPEAFGLGGGGSTFEDVQLHGNDVQLHGNDVQLHGNDVQLHGNDIQPQQASMQYANGVNPRLRASPDCYIRDYTASTSTFPPAPALMRHAHPKSRVQHWKDSLELRWLDAHQRWEPTLERWWQRRHVLRRAACGILGIVLLVAWWAGSFSDPASYVPEAARPTWARHGESGVDFAATSTDITCPELEAGSLARLTSSAEEPSLARLRAYATHVLLGTAAEREAIATRKEGREAKEGPRQTSCVCAPMFGTRRRYMAIRVGDRVQHLYNPSLDGTWHGALPDGRAVAATGLSLVEESQRMLFPGRSEAVENVRHNAIRLSFRDEACRASGVVLQQEVAWCAQACLDLMQGTTVYDKAAARQVVTREAPNKE